MEDLNLVVGKQYQFTIYDYAISIGVVKEIKKDKVLIDVFEIISECYPNTDPVMGLIEVTKGEIYEVREAA